MADNYTQTSTQIKCTSPEAADYLIQLLGNPVEVHSEFVEYSPCCAYERESEYEIWIYSDDFFDDGLMLITLAKWVKKFPSESGIISFSFSCSKMRLDEFGGGAIAFAEGKVKYFDPVSYANKWLEKRKVKDEATTD